MYVAFVAATRIHFAPMNLVRTRARAREEHIIASAQQQKTNQQKNQRVCSFSFFFVAATLCLLSTVSHPHRFSPKNASCGSGGSAAAPGSLVKIGPPHERSLACEQILHVGTIPLAECSLRMLAQ